MEKKRKITVSSAKAKGRRLQNFICEEFIKRHPNLRKGDIRPAIMGESGTDIKMSPAAKDIIPFDIECKNTQSFNKNLAINQAEINSEENRVPLVVFKKNRSKIYSIISLDDLIKFIKS